jgi:UPF0716 family protein affecting phage T7 exclusion
MLVLVAGALMVAPGVLTDLTALALLLPPVRARVAGYVGKRIRTKIERKLRDGSLFVHGGGPGPGPFGAGSYEVIDAEDIPRRDPR